MTLIAFTREPRSGLTFLLGDILLSKESLTSQDIPLITSPFNSSKIKVGSGSISGTERKICIINDEFLVAWCNSKIKAKILLQDIKEHFEAKKNITPQEVYDFLNTFNEKELKPYPKLGEVSLIVMLNKGVFRWDSDVGQKKTGDEPKQTVIGSGTNYYIDILNDITTDQASLKALQESPSFIPANILCRLLTTEILTGYTLENGFGGWFEFINPSEEGFKPWTNYTVFLWDLFIKDGELEIRAYPTWIFKPFYVGETLGILKTSIGLFQEDEIQIREGFIEITPKPEFNVLFVNPIIGDGIKIEDIKIPEDFSYECWHHIHLFNPSRLPFKDKEQNQLVCMVSDSNSSPVHFDKKISDHGFKIHHKNLLNMIVNIEKMLKPMLDLS